MSISRHHQETQRDHSSFVVIQVRAAAAAADTFQQVPVNKSLNFSAMKLFNRFRKILMRVLFSASSTSSMASKHKATNCDIKYDPPKTSCSSYYSSQSHYSEAIADCIEFFNKSSQDGILDGRKSDAWV